MLDFVYEESFGNPIDRDAALLQLNSSCLVWSGGVQLAAGGWGRLRVASTLVDPRRCH